MNGVRVCYRDWETVRQLDFKQATGWRVDNGNQLYLFKRVEAEDSSGYDQIAAFAPESWLHVYMIGEESAPVSTRDDCKNIVG